MADVNWSGGFDIAQFDIGPFDWSGSDEAETDIYASARFNISINATPNLGFDNYATSDFILFFRFFGSCDLNIEAELTLSTWAILQSAAYQLNFDAGAAEIGIDFLGAWLLWQVNISPNTFFDIIFDQDATLSLNHFAKPEFMLDLAQYAFLSFNHYAAAQQGVIVVQNLAKLSMNYYNKEAMAWYAWFVNSSWMDAHEVEFINVSAVIPPGSTLVIDTETMTCYVYASATGVVTNVIHLHSGPWLFLDPYVFDVDVVTSTGTHETKLMYTERYK